MIFINDNDNDGEYYNESNHNDNDNDGEHLWFNDNDNHNDDIWWILWYSSMMIWDYRFEYTIYDIAVRPFMELRIWLWINTY